ncbi:TetR family transcriptional regulator [marine bacterium AO1-C]|nr:TetR family transcriptional regulator [marine bacterium AO1-C]
MSKGEETRAKILEKAFHLIYQNGYQATSIDNIIKQIQETKGAFYYHFPNKQKMGLAVINEIIYPRLMKNLIEPLQQALSPTEAIYHAFSQFLLKTSDFQIRFGCPTNNLIQEMSPLNESFNEALKKIIDKWQNTIVEVLKTGQKKGQIQTEIDVESVALFVVVGYEGLRSVGKIYQSKTLYQAYLRQLKAYLSSIKA